MPWNGSGTPVRNQDFTDDRDAGAPDHFIQAELVDDEFDNLITMLTNCLTRDGQNKPSADLPMNAKKHTNVANGALRTQYGSLGQIQDGAPFYLTSVSGTDAITATAPYSMTELAAGQGFRFVAADTNTGPVTLNVNSIGAEAIQKNGAALVAGDITSGDGVEVLYDGTQFQLISPHANIASIAENNTFSGDDTFSGTVTFSGSVTFSNTVTLPNDSIDSEHYVDSSIDPAHVNTAVTAIGSVGGGSTAIDLSTVNRNFTATLTGNQTFTVSNPKAAGNGDSFLIQLTFSGSYTPTFTGVTWPNGTPTWPSSGTVNVIIWTLDGGTTKYGVAVGL